MPADDAAFSWVDIAKLSRVDAAAAGRAARKGLPRSAHAEWQPAASRPDPVALLRASDAQRLPELLALRYGRMLQSPFTYLRGSASVMAFDLSRLPITGIRTQICGDAHLLNFGAFATPERHLAFDVNDFDETTPGAWEWDLKRLVASVAVAGRHLGLRAGDRREALVRCAGGYRRRMLALARMHVMDVWYARLDEPTLVDVVRSAQARREFEDVAARARRQTNAHAYPRLTEEDDGKRRFVDEPPLTFHEADDSGFAQRCAAMFAGYRESLSDDRTALLDRFRLVDVAFRVVGIGSVGTRCLVALFLAGADDPLILQAKEAVGSVFAPYAGSSRYLCAGERVVVGQRLMQAASDLFLGWTTTDDGHDFYIRQLRDMKTSANVEQMTPADLTQYAEFCGWALARAHAKAGGVAPAVAAYLGRGNVSDLALADFAEAYALQNEVDYQRLAAAVRAGEMEAVAPNDG